MTFVKTIAIVVIFLHALPKNKGKVKQVGTLTEKNRNLLKVAS